MNNRQLSVVLKILEQEERSKSWLARHIGVTRAMMNHWGSGNTPIKDVYKKRISKVLNIPESVLFPDA